MINAQFYTEVQFSKEITLVVGYNRVNGAVLLQSIELVDSFGIDLLNHFDSAFKSKVKYLIENGATINLNMGET